MQIYLFFTANQNTFKKIYFGFEFLTFGGNYLKCKKKTIQAWSKIMKKGTIMVPFSKNIRVRFFKTKNYCSNVEKEFIEIGDAGEKIIYWFGRFITDIKKPKIVKNKYSKKVISILKKKKLINFIKKVLKTKKNIYLRRVQFNEIGKNCFVGYHLDR